MAGMVLFYPLAGLPPEGGSLALVDPAIAARMDLAKAAIDHALAFAARK